MRNLYIIESPFQLLNANEAMSYFPADENELWVRYSKEEKNDKQIKTTLKELEVFKKAKVKEVTIRANNKTLVDVFKIILLKLVLFTKSYGMDKLFIGNYDSNVIGRVLHQRKKIVLLDDGAKTINTQQSFSAQNNYNWFSVFQLSLFPGQKLYENEYLCLHKVITDTKTTSEDSILFIGSKLSECGIIEESYYLKLIQQIASRFSTYKILYVTHRSESPKKLQKLQEYHNIELVDIDYPIELFPVYNDTMPAKIVSFYSTALITLHKIFKVEAMAFKFDYQNTSYSKQIAQVYDYCAEHITVVEEKDILSEGQVT